MISEFVLITNLIAAAIGPVDGVTNAREGSYSHAWGWGHEVTAVVSTNTQEMRLNEGGYLTDPTESITVTTNVTHWTNQRGCETCHMIQQSAHSGGMILIHHECDIREPYKPATEKTETTEVVEIRTLRFSWMGKEHEVTDRRILSSNTRRWVLKEEWAEQ